MSKTKDPIPPAKLEQYDRLIENHPSIERKGKTMPYTSGNGYMFSFLDNTGTMGLRLNKEDREIFIKKYGSGLMMQHGREMKEFVIVPENLLEDTKELAAYLQKGYKYVNSLKPKATSKKK